MLHTQIPPRLFFMVFVLDAIMNVIPDTLGRSGDALGCSGDALGRFGDALGCWPSARLSAPPAVVWIFWELGNPDFGKLENPDFWGIQILGTWKSRNLGCKK